MWRGIGKDRIENLALLLEDLIDPLLNRIEREKAADRDRPRRADSMRPIDRLIFDSRVPPAIEEKHITGELQIQPHAPGAIADQEYVPLGIVVELLNDGVALSG